MLGRKDYTKDELATGRQLVEANLAGYRKVAKGLGGGAKHGGAALASFEPVFANSLVLALDRIFVHRLRMVTGKDTNALNEVELVVDSLISNNGVFRANTVVKYEPENAVLQLKAGDPIKLTIEQAQALAAAFLDEIEAKFV